jgi:hypothetical protein
MSVWLNLAGYQLVWFAAVIGAGNGMAWPGVIAMLVFAAWQLARSQQRRIDLQLVAVALLLGATIDGSLALSGWAIYAAPAPALPSGGAPIWILALWIAFALTLDQTLLFLQTRIGLAVLFGAIGAPLAYAGAARGWNAVTFAAPAWHALAAIALGWAVAMPLLAALARHWKTTAPSLHTPITRSLQ